MNLDDTAEMTTPSLGINQSEALPTNPSKGTGESLLPNDPPAVPFRDVADDAAIVPGVSERNTTGDAKETLPATGNTATFYGGSDRDNLNCGCKIVKGGKNLVVCIDGTGNQFGKKNSNVVELYSLLLKDHRQQTWYNSGIGTFAKPSHIFDLCQQHLWSMWDKAVAWNPERIVLGAYRWLSDNYRPGDRIFIFGFSRGAYQARVISAMIDRVGLLHKGNEMQIPFAYDLYRRRSRKKKKKSRTATPNSEPDGGNFKSTTESKIPEKPTIWGKLKAAFTCHKGADGDTSKSASESNTPTIWENFKATFCHQDVKVHFVGAWDTVSSIGIIRPPELLPGTTDGMKHVCYFRHALALDERRVKFLPEYATGGVSEDPNAKSEPNSNADTKAKRTKLLQVKEVWFAGTHSDIGGGNIENRDMLRSVPPLRWMASEAKKAGLLIKIKNDFLAIEEIKAVESLTCLWWIMEFLPVKQLAYKDPVSTKHSFNNGKGRKVCVGQKIHVSVLQTKTGYSPKADVSALDTNRDDLKGEIWRCLTTSADSKFSQYLEQNKYERARILVMQAAQNDTRNIQLALLKGDPVEGPMTQVEKDIVAPLDLVDIKSILIAVVIDMLKAKNSFPLDSKLIGSVIRNIGDAPVQRVHWRRHEDSALISHMLRPDPSNPDASNVDQDVANTFLRKFTVPIITTDTRGWYQVAFSKDGKHLFSGGQGGTLRIWDAETGESQGKLETGMERIFSLAASPGEAGLCFVGGHHPDAGKNVQVLEGTKNVKPLVTPGLIRVSTAVWSIGLFKENIVTTSNDGSIRVWRWSDSDCPIAKEFQVDDVQSAVFSFDGTKVVAASLRGIRVVDSEAEVLVKAPDTDEYAAYNVATDKNLVVGASKPIIRVWDANTGEQAAVLAGHTDTVWSVCFATNSTGRRFIVSGCDDGLVKVWDVKTYRWRKDLEGHSAGVTSVVFSPASNRVASADRNGTIMVWECDRF